MKIFFVIILLLALIPINAFGEDMIKQPNVAGQFYEADPQSLSKQIDFFFAQADVEPIKEHVAAVMVPHAGYFYSGGVAAYSFKAASAHDYKTIILLGPTHYYRFDGVSVWPKGGFKTPLGTIQVDEEFVAALMQAAPSVKPMPQAFERDHVLEVEMPFIQKTFKDAKIVPLIMSRDVPMETLKELAGAFDKVIGDRKNVLIVISSDQSHYHPDEDCRRIDKRGLGAAVAMDIDALWEGHHNGVMEIDGFKEVITALLYAKIRNLKNVKLLKHANSSDVTGDKSRVVGYAAMAIY